jgi:uncharacterized protein YbjT (DUF2867 family)
MTERGHVLVTGGSGFVGSAIVRELLAHGFRLRLAVRDPRQAASLGDTVSAAVIGDLAEPVDWSRHLGSRGGARACRNEKRGEAAVQGERRSDRSLDAGGTPGGRARDRLHLVGARRHRHAL